MARNIKKSTEWEAFYLQNQHQPSYHEFYGLYTSIARNIAGRPSDQFIIKESSPESDLLGFSTPASNSICASDSWICNDAEEKQEASNGQRNFVKIEKAKPERNHQNFIQKDKKKFNKKNFVRIEKDNFENFPDMEYQNESDELFHQLKSIVSNTLLVTVLQTSIALVKAGLSESLDLKASVKKEKAVNIKQEPRNGKKKRHFFSLGRNRFLPKSRFITKKGQFQVGNLLKFSVNNS